MTASGIPVDVDLLRNEIRRTYTDVSTELVDTYARSTFEDTRRKALKYGAMGSTIRATKPAA